MTALSQELPWVGFESTTLLPGRVLYQLSYQATQLVGVQNNLQHKGKPQTTVLWHSILSLSM